MDIVQGNFGFSEGQNGPPREKIPSTLTRPGTSWTAIAMVILPLFFNIILLSLYSSHSRACVVVALPNPILGPKLNNGCSGAKSEGALPNVFWAKNSRFWPNTPLEPIHTGLSKGNGLCQLL